MMAMPSYTVWPPGLHSRAEISIAGIMKREVEAHIEARDTTTNDPAAASTTFIHVSINHVS